MPTKKGGSHVTEKPDTKVEEKEPLGMVLSIIDKKTRNLEKRKSRLKALSGEMNDGKDLDKDQLDAISKLPEVSIQIETLRDLSQTVQQAYNDYQKEVKKQQKLEEKHRKETERETQQCLLKYSLRVQGILNLIDDTAKEALRTGTEGAVKVSEAELTQLDKFYDLVNPTRPGNELYDRHLTQASDHLILLFEKSTKEVVQTTYGNLHGLLEKLDSCGYFDKVIEEKEEEEEEEKEEYDNPVKEPPEAVKTVPEPSPFTRAESPELMSSQLPLHVVTEPVNPPAATTQTDDPFVPLVPMTTEGYHPSAPSPDFSGLQTAALSPLGELTFMRESPTHPLIEPAAESQAQFTGGSYGSGGSNTHQSFTSFQPTSGHAPLAEPTPVGVLESGTLLLDGQYVPETGQQVTEEKEKVKDKPTDFSSNKTYSQRGNNKQWRGNGGYNRGNRDMYNSGGNGYGRGYQGGGRGGSNSYRGGSGNRGRPNYTYNNRSTRGGGGGGSGYKQYGRPVQ